MQELEQRAPAQAAQLELGGAVSILRSAYMRYSGQGYDVRVSLPAGPIDDEYEKRMRAAFYETYRKEYGFFDADAEIEATDWYVVASLASKDRRFFEGRDEACLAPTGPAITGEREAYFPELGGMTASRILDRYRMKSNEKFEGPCLVEERESTTVVLPGDNVHVDQVGHLVIEINRAQRNVR